MLHNCGTETQVIDSRRGSNGATRRRRQCPKCRVRFTTYEMSEAEMTRYNDMNDKFSKIKLLVGG